MLNAIRSIENQTYKNYELILINDDSNEKEYYEYNFPEFVKKIDIKKKDFYKTLYKQRDPKAKHLPKKNVK